MSLDIFSDIKAGEYEFCHSALTFVNPHKFKYVIVSGLYDGYPIYTDNLYGTLKTLFKEIGEYEMQLYLENQEDELDDDEYEEKCFSTEYLQVNDIDIVLSLDGMTALLDTETFRNAEPCTIEDACGSNYGSGIYVGE